MLIASWLYLLSRVFATTYQGAGDDVKRRCEVFKWTNSSWRFTKRLTVSKWIESQVFWKCFGTCFESQVLRNYVPEVIILLYWHCFAQRTLSCSSRPLHLLSSSSESVQGTKYASLSHPWCAWDPRIRLLQTFSLGGLGHGRLFINSQKIDIVYGVAMSILLQFLSSSNVICLADGSTRMYTAQFVIM